MLQDGRGCPGVEQCLLEVLCQTCSPAGVHCAGAATERPAAAEAAPREAPASASWLSGRSPAWRAGTLAGSQNVPDGAPHLSTAHLASHARLSLLGRARVCVTTKTGSPDEAGKKMRRTSNSCHIETGH